jgi:hypothetical protein
MLEYLKIHKAQRLQKSLLNKACIQYIMLHYFS